MPSRRNPRILLASLGVCLFFFLVWRMGPLALLSSIRQIGWGFAGVFLLGGLSHVVKTWAWRYTLPAPHRSLPFGPMLRIRLAGEAVSQLTVAGQLAGETTRALLLKQRIPMVAGVSSVVLDRMMFTFTAMLFALAGIGFSLLVLPLPGDFHRYSVWVVVVASAMLALAVLSVRRRWPFLSGPLRLLGRILGQRLSLDGYLAPVLKVESTIQEFYCESHASFWKSFLLNSLGHGLAMAEVYVILRLLGLNVTLASVFVIEALTKLINLGGFLIPGNLGASEGGNMLVLNSLGLGTANGLALAVARRLRGLFWTAAGLALLYTGNSSTRGHGNGQRARSPRDEA